MIVRLNTKAGGKVNLVATSIIGFTEEADRSSVVSLANGSSVHVSDSAQSIRGQFKRLAAPAATPEAASEAEAV